MTCCGGPPRMSVARGRRAFVHVIRPNVQGRQGTWSCGPASIMFTKPMHDDLRMSTFANRPRCEWLRRMAEERIRIDGPRVRSGFPILSFAAAGISTMPEQVSWLISGPSCPARMHSRLVAFVFHKEYSIRVQYAKSGLINRRSKQGWRNVRRVRVKCGGRHVAMSFDMLLVRLGMK